MKKQTHYIQKQQVTLDFETEEEARHWNSRFSEYYYENILPHVNSLLDNIIPDDRSYIIKRLEIDLGNIHMNEFPDVFLKKTERELKRILKNDASPGFSGSERAGQKDSHQRNDLDQTQQDEPGKTGRSPLGQNRQDKNLRIKKPEEHVLEDFFHFLDHGIFLWNSEFETVAVLEAAIRQEIGLEKLTDSTGFRERMISISARRRFCYQFSETFTEEMFNRLYSDELSILSSLKGDLEKHLLRLAKDATSREKIKQELSKGIGARLIEAGPADTRKWPQYFIRSALEELSSHLKVSGETSIFKAILGEISQSSPLEIYLRKLVTSKEFEESETIQDQQSADKRDQDESVGKPLKDRHKTKEDESSRGSVEEPVQKPSDEMRTDGQINTGDESSQELSDDIESGKEIVDEISPGESARQRNESDADPEKSKLPDTGRSGTPDSEDIASRPGSNTSKGESPEKSESDQKSEKKPFTDLPEYDIEKDRQADFPEVLEEYYLRRAGIVLCWPYLSRLFTNLEYLEDKIFKASGYQQRAVHLLGYIASGAEQCEEHELILAKFLCAWPLQMPIIRELELTGEEKNSADEMLSSLISHWSVLKNTSVEGLRESFFSREGKLFKEDEQWKLIVEQESYDMLLDHLPFSISMIKLPWMKEILKVDWA